MVSLFIEMDGMQIPVAGPIPGIIPFPVFLDHLPLPGDTIQFVGENHKVTHRTFAMGSSYIIIHTEKEPT